jgi:hypothetical protein
METGPTEGPTASFAACECGKHGRIVLASGFYGAEVAFKQHALHFVRTGVQWERLSDAEVEKVTEEILASSLPMTPEEAGPVMIYKCEIYRVMRVNYRIEGGEPALIHLYLQMPMNEIKIPKDLFEKVHEMLQTAAPH